MPKFVDNSIEGSKTCRRILLSELNSHDSHDVLHTSLAYALVVKCLPAEAKTLNLRQLFSSLVLRSLQRLIKYEKIGSEEDLEECKKHYSFLVFTPLAFEFLHGKIDTPESLISKYLAKVQELEEAA